MERKDLDGGGPIQAHFTWWSHLLSAVSQPVSVHWGAREGHVFQAKCRWSREMLQLRPGLTHSNANVMLVEAQISELMSLFLSFLGFYIL